LWSYSSAKAIGKGEAQMSGVENGRAPEQLQLPQRVCEVQHGTIFACDPVFYPGFISLTYRDLNDRSVLS
jgi:hypothetical protein